MNFEKWLQTEQGKKCNDNIQPIHQPYLQNRLWWAYHAGAEGFDETYTVKQISKELAKAHKTIGELRKRVVQ